MSAGSWSTTYGSDIFTASARSMFSTVGNGINPITYQKTPITRQYPKLSGMLQLLQVPT